MRMLFAGPSFCELATFKRMLLVAEEIAFIDFALTPGQTVETDSVFRDLLKGFQGGPVTFSVRIPPLEAAGDPGELKLAYLRQDEQSPVFRRILLDGLAQSENFRRKALNLDFDYGGQTGREIIDAIVRDASMQTAPIGLAARGLPLRPQDPAWLNRRFLERIVGVMSMSLTDAMMVADENDLMVVSDDPFVPQLLGLRYSDKGYIGDVPSFAPLLGLEWASAVVPDKALSRLTLDQLMDYRAKAGAAYQGWFVELNKMTASLDQMSANEAIKQFPRFRAAEFAPKLREYENDMRAVSEKLFGDVVKTFFKYEVPSVALAYWFAKPGWEVMAAFAALSPLGPALVEYLQSRRATRRKHGSAYLIDVAKKGRG